MAQQIPINLKFRCGIGRGRTIRFTITNLGTATISKVVLGVGAPTPIIRRSDEPDSGIVIAANVITVTLLPEDTVDIVPKAILAIDIGMELDDDPETRRDLAVGTVEFESRVGTFEVGS